MVFVVSSLVLGMEHIKSSWNLNSVKHVEKYSNNFVYSLLVWYKSSII